MLCKLVDSRVLSRTLVFLRRPSVSIESLLSYFYSGALTVRVGCLCWHAASCSGPLTSAEAVDGGQVASRLEAPLPALPEWAFGRSPFQRWLRAMVAIRSARAAYVT